VSAVGGGFEAAGVSDSRSLLTRPRPKTTLFESKERAEGTFAIFPAGCESASGLNGRKTPACRGISAMCPSSGERRLFRGRYGYNSGGRRTGAGFGDGDGAPTCQAA